jgi:hypothetical protein
MNYQRTKTSLHEKKARRWSDAPGMTMNPSQGTTAMAEQITPPFDWHKHLKVHPAADLFPELGNGELEGLAADIKQQGLRVPIILFDGQLLDGRNRLNAAQKEGLLSLREGGLSIKWPDGHIEILRREEVRGDPYGIVLAFNIHRRHLTAEQRRDLIAALLKAKPDQSDRQIAKQTKTSPSTVGTIRKKSEVTGDVSKLDTRTDTKGRKQPSTKPQKPSKPASSAKIDPIGSPPVRYSEVPATSVSPESRPHSISARDVALDDFTARAMELIRLTRNKSARRFAKTALPDDGIRQLAKLFSDLINIRNENVVDRICGSAEGSTEQRRAEHAALDKAAS